MQCRLSRILLTILFLAFSLTLEARADTTAITSGSITFSSIPSEADNSFFLQGEGLSLSGSTRYNFIFSTLMIDTDISRSTTINQRVFDSSDGLIVRLPFTLGGNTFSNWAPLDDSLHIKFSGTTAEFPANPTSDVVTISAPFTMTGLANRHTPNIPDSPINLTGNGIVTAVYTHGPVAPIWYLKKITYKFASTGPNPIDQTDFFIRQHYIDFLDRGPEQAGFTGWRDILNNCGRTVAQPCDRIEVSSDFFRSAEFESRGYFIYLYYSALGQMPHYDQFMVDYQKLDPFSNLSPQGLENNKAAFANQFVTRADFVNKYGSITDPTTFVNALLQTTGLLNHPQRGDWVNELTNGTLSRAAVLRALVESPELRQKYYNEAFVVMQYFGYLRRDPDIHYLEWIETMNKTGDYRTMINGFLNSVEYRQRFGS